MTNKPIYSFPSGPQTKQMAAAEAAIRQLQAKKAGSGGGSGSGNGGGGGYGGGGHAPPSPGLPMGSGNAINGDPAINLFSTGGNYQIRRQPAGQNFMTSYYIEKYNAIRGDLYFNDFSGGIDAQVRRISDGVFSNELAYSSLDASHSRTMILPPLVTADTSAGNTIGTLEAMSACYLNDGGTARWLVAAGDTADKCLFALTSSITAQTYTPSSNIISLTTVKIATNTERVIVGRAGAAAQVLTEFDGTPTTSGTMHANTAACWGVIRSPLNSTTPGAETLLMYCGGSGATLYSLSSTAAIGDAPTAVLTNWPSGGYALGRATLWFDGVERAYWVHPLNSQATSMLDTMLPGKIVSTNLEGTDPKEIIIPGLQFVKHAMMWRGGIVATDGKAVVWINGETTVNLGWNRERKWEIDGVTSIGTVQCIAPVGDRLLVCVGRIFSEDVGSDYVREVWEEYLAEDNTWHFFVSNGADGPLPMTAACTGQTPVYQPHNTKIDNGLFYWYTCTAGIGPAHQWNSAPLLASGINPGYQQAASAWINYKYATGASSAAYAITPIYEYMGLPMVVTDIHSSATFLNTSSQVEIEIASQTAHRLEYTSYTTVDPQSAVFKYATDWRRNWWINPFPDGSMMDKLQFKIILTQGSATSNGDKTSPNALPFRVGFYVFLDGIYKDPKVMESQRFWGPRE